MQFQKSSVPNRLSIKDIHRLYKNLKSGVDQASPKTYLMDEVLDLMDGIDTESFKASLRIMYGNNVAYATLSPVDFALMFVKGLKKCNAFEFFDFMRTLSRGTPK